jgi:hypothetical protein
MNETQYRELLSDIKRIVREELNKQQGTAVVGTWSFAPGATPGGVVYAANGCDHEFERIESTVPYLQCKKCYERQDYTING